MAQRETSLSTDRTIERIADLSAGLKSGQASSISDNSGQSDPFLRDEIRDDWGSGDAADS